MQFQARDDDFLFGALLISSFASRSKKNVIELQFLRLEAAMAAVFDKDILIIK